jgi:hypothetical protein
MSSPKSVPVFNTIEKYSSIDGTTMLIKHFSDGGYIQAEPGRDGHELSMFWATNQSALDSLSNAGRVCGLPDGESAFIIEGMADIEEGAAPEIIRAMWRDRNRPISSYMIEGSTYDLAWCEPARRWKWSDSEYAQIGLTVKSLPRAYVEALLITTGIESVTRAAPQTLSEFAVEVPLLRQA